MTAPQLPPPPGDPEGLRAAAALLDRVAGDLDGARERFGRQTDRLGQVWVSDQAAGRALAEGSTLGTAAGSFAQTVRGGGDAVRGYAAAVEQAQQAGRGLRQRAQAVQAETASALARAPDGMRQHVLDEAAAAYRGLQGQYDQLLAELKQAARQARSRLESLVPRYRPGTIGSQAAAAAPAATAPGYEKGGAELVQHDGKEWIRLHPGDPRVPQGVEIPNNSDAKGFKIGPWYDSTHTYSVPYETGIPWDQGHDLIGQELAKNPTPGADQPATPEGTPNDALFGGLGHVKTYSIPSPDPDKYTDMIVNYTEPDHTLNEGWVMRWGERTEDGSITLHTYGEGTNWKQHPMLSPLWGPYNGILWTENSKQISSEVRDRLGLPPPPPEIFVPPP
jgi:hypothetical protein